MTKRDLRGLISAFGETARYVGSYDRFCFSKKRPRDAPTPGGMATGGLILMQNEIIVSARCASVWTAKRPHLVPSSDFLRRHA